MLAADVVVTIDAAPSVQTTDATLASQVLPAAVRTVMIWPTWAAPARRAPHDPSRSLAGEPVAVEVRVTVVATVGVAMER